MELDNTGLVESLQGTASHVIGTLKGLIHEGNIRKILVRHEGRTIAEFPLTVGVVGVAVLPQLAAIGAIAALATECTIEVQRADASSAANTGT
jgi:uncharacterized protein DUF4342